MKNVRNFEEMVAEFRYIFRDIENGQEVMQVLRVLKEYFTLLEAVQKLPLRLRLKFWACASVVFFYLQMNEQLGRNVGAFDSAVKRNVQKVMKSVEFFVPQKGQK